MAPSGTFVPLASGALDLPSSQTSKPSIRRLSLAQSKSKNLPIMTFEEVQERVQKGDILIIFGNKVYNLTKWVKFHPGGDLAIIHMNGKDATDVILAYHPEWAIEKKMPHFCIAELDTTSIVSDTPAAIRSKKISTSYRQLDAKIRQMGLYQTDFTFYMKEGIKFLIIWVAALSLAMLYPSSVVAVTASALLFGLLWHQGAFVAHDAGHTGITHDAWTDTVFGISIANFLGGLSLGWWKKNHNVHHIITNHPEHDPDIQHLPFVAVSVRFMESLYSTYYKARLDFDNVAKIFVPLQHRLFYIVLCFGRFNLYANSFAFLANRGKVPHRWFEIAGITFFWSWYAGILLRGLPSWWMIALHVLVSHMSTVILHVQITLSHFGMDTSEPRFDETYAELALRTTMDVDCSTWMDWFHGGLQFQVEHHLFPRVPRHNLRKTRPLVLEFCKEHDLPFVSFDFLTGNHFVINRLEEVAKEVKAAVAAGSIPEPSRDRVEEARPLTSTSAAALKMR
ncbi:hypothetical protein HDU97_002844 [Phlyctochytrium planicorne]|nr:hypothetical protein HDU97_002844 [Phlyctochytrium planicorne]